MIFGLKNATSRTELVALSLLLLISVALLVAAATMPPHGTCESGSGYRAGHAAGAVGSIK